MSKIDLSKAKIGDKFRTGLGYIVIFTGLYKYGKKYKYMFDRVDDKYCGCFCDINGVPSHNKEMYTIVEQVFDKPLDELIEEGTKQIKENDDAIAEEKELQRRQEVVELAEKLVTNELFAVTNHLHDMRELGAAINLDSPTEYAFLIAEEFVNNKSKYLENGKLC